MLRRALTVSVLLLSVARIAGAQTGVVSGVVTARQADDSALARPARGALVSFRGTPETAATDAGGRFQVEVPAGSVVMRVRLDGFRLAERALTVRPGDTTRVDVVLLPDVQMLAPVRAISPDEERFTARPSVGVTVLGATAMDGIPSVGEPDVVRVAQMLPGVSARNDFSSALHVRGGEGDQNLVLMDGYPIYNPFHFGGIFSTFMDATVGGVSLSTAAFPARYGGRLSSVMEVRSADETRTGVNTTADISAIGATAKTGGLFGNRRGSWSLAARRTYADAVTEIFTDDFFPYHFRDVHAHFTYVLPNGTRVAATAYDGKDVLDANLASLASDSIPSRATEGRWRFDWGNRVAGVSIANDFGARVTAEQRLSTSSFSTTLDLGNGASVQRNDVRSYTADGWVTVDAGAHEPSIGYEASTYRLRYASGSPASGSSPYDIVQKPVATVLWAEDLWHVSGRWLVQAGARAEALGESGWSAVSPRLSVKFFAAPDVAVTAAAGRVTQWMQSLSGDGPLRYFDVWLASDRRTPVASAWHYALGLERRPSDATSVRVETWVKRYDRVLDVNPSEDPQVQGDEFLPATGLSYGGDVLARWSVRAGGPHGWIAYSYGLSSRTRGDTTWAPGHDRRHDLDVVAMWPWRQYRFGARFGLASGTPFTAIVGEVPRWTYDPSTDTWNGGEQQFSVDALGAARNGARLPLMHRLDVDVSRDYVLRGAKVSPYLSVANAYNASNVFVYVYDYSVTPGTRRAVSQFPIIPSAGVRVAF